MTRSEPPASGARARKFASARTIAIVQSPKEAGKEGKESAEEPEVTRRKTRHGTTGVAGGSGGVWVASACCGSASGCHRLAL